MFIAFFNTFQQMQTCHMLHLKKTLIALTYGFESQKTFHAWLKYADHVFVTATYDPFIFKYLHTYTRKLTVLMSWRLQQLGKLHIDMNLHSQGQTHFQQHQLELPDALDGCTHAYSYFLSASYITDNQGILHFTAIKYVYYYSTQKTNRDIMIISNSLTCFLFV